MTSPPDFIDSADLVPEQTGARVRPDDATWPESSTLPQRAIKLILDAGISYYGQPGQQAAIRRALPFLEEDELAITEELISTRPLKVVHGFIKRNANLPVVAIVLGKESNSKDEAFINDFSEVGTDTYGDAGWGNIDTHCVGFDTVLRLVVVTDNVDVTIMWYEMVKFILIQARLILVRLGIESLKINGSDVEAAEKDEAELIFTRELTMHFRTRQVFAEEVNLVTHLNMYVQEFLTSPSDVNVYVSIGPEEEEYSPVTFRRPEPTV